MTDAGLAYCLDLLRKADPDRYLSVLYLPRAARPAAAAIHAFDAEISRIPDLVSQPAPGEIRLQWWREVIGGERESGNHPLAAALLGAIERHGLPRQAFAAYLDARVFDLYHDAMPDRPALEGYCGETASALLQMVAIAAGAAPGPSLSDACGHGGVAAAMAGLVRRAGYHRTRERCYIPAELLAAAGLDRESWLFRPADDRHLAAVRAMVMVASEHAGLTRRAAAELDRAGRGALLPLAPVAAYLDAVERAGQALFASVPDISPLRRHFLFWRAARRA